ncbi:MAG TPA: RNA polymerase sigma factor [Pyrinomonadaceae bacterium]|nr:RNA polymerase sigma factor [Pyrinomonadaceae bacterium]
MSEKTPQNPQITQAVANLQRGIEIEQNFRQIFDFYFRPLQRFFQRKTFSPEEALDLTQETFFSVYNKLEQFRGDAPFEAWLWQIAVNVYRQKIERQTAQKRTADIVSLEDKTDSDLHLRDESFVTPLDNLLQTEQREQLRTVIEELPEQMRKCMILRVFQDLSYRQIAVVMRISEQTVKAHLFQGRQRLRERLGEYFEEVKF